MTKLTPKERVIAVEAMWADGLSLKEMAKVLGSTPNAVQVAMVKWRDRGADLPFRGLRKKARR